MNLRLVVGLLVLLPCRPQGQPATEAAQIRQLIANYAGAVDAADVKLAAQVWDNSPEVSFIHPLGHARGWEQVKAFYTDIMGGLFSERKLTPRDINVHVYGDSAWSEFYWHFTATQKKDGALVQSDGRETQIYRKRGRGWVLVHVHYSEMPKDR
ncbi:MAG TPA: nuclear transport factor 2 family protein [Bryobacteraceae bacterium]|nr:nuclear transport factor 2 family protein [Bryobacteraceae bacterium]